MGRIKQVIVIVAKYPQGKRKGVSPKKGKVAVKKTENPSSYVLRMLLAASPHYVSGSMMAQKLKMSRVGVWSRVDRLRKAGL